MFPRNSFIFNDLRQNNKVTQKKYIDIYIEREREREREIYIYKYVIMLFIYLMAVKPLILKCFDR